MKLSLSFLILFLLFSGFSLDEQEVKIEVQISAEELKLYNLLMEYRKQKNLPSIPLSKSLTYVAQLHCKDLVENKPHLKTGCNMHSWSNKGKWTACCYTDDHKQSAKMWSKPKELTSYTDAGYEIAFGTEGFTATAQNSLAGWKSSKGHNAVIINQAPWNVMKWNAIGVGIHEGFAMVWFGVAPDAEGEPEKPTK